MTTVFDATVLLGTDEWAAANLPQYRSRAAAAEFDSEAAVLAAADFELANAVVMPFPSATPLRSNAEALAERSSSVDLDYAYGIIPGRPELLDDLERRLLGGEPIVGIKCWPFTGNFHHRQLLDDARLMQMIRAHHLVVYVHVATGREHLTRPAFPNNDARPADAFRVAERLPETVVILSHCARLSESALRELRAQPNCYVEISGLPSIGRWIEGGHDVLLADDAIAFDRSRLPSIIERLVHDFDLADRMLFASTWPFCTWWNSSILEQARLVSDAAIGEDAKTRILASTAREIFAGRG